MQDTVFEFGCFRLELSPLQLRAHGRIVHLTPKALETLVVLARNAGRLVTKQELMRTVWPDVHVGTSGLARNVSALRAALGSEGAGFIETHGRQGYRFGAHVTTTRAVPAGDAQPVLSLAVLPFTRVDGGRADDYLGLRIADALIGRLSGSRRLIVRPTNAVRLFAGPAHDPIVAGRTLKVDCVLDGCMRVCGRRVRVTVQLVAVHNGAVLWSAKFDDEAEDVFTLEDSIAASVSEALSAQLAGGAPLRPAKRGTASAQAHQAYLRGRHYWNRRSETGLRRALECFNEAIHLDPVYGPAYAGLADAHIMLASFAYGAFRPHDAWPRARAAAVRALELDDQLAEAHTSLAFIRFRYDWDWDAAERGFQHALELNPHYATARQWYGYLLSTRGRHDEAMHQIRLAQALDPLSAVIATGVGRFLYFAGRDEEAVVQCRKAIEMDGTFVGAHLDLGIVLEQLGRYDEAIAELGRACDLSGRSHVPLVHLAHALAVAGRGDEARAVEEELIRAGATSYVAPSDWAVLHLGLRRTDLALECLERAYAERTSFMVLLRVEPLLAPLRDHPRFQMLLDRVDRGVAPVTVSEL